MTKAMLQEELRQPMLERRSTLCSHHPEAPTARSGGGGCRGFRAPAWRPRQHLLWWCLPPRRPCLARLWRPRGLRSWCRFLWSPSRSPTRRSLTSRQAEVLSELRRRALRGSCLALACVTRTRQASRSADGSARSTSTWSLCCQRTSRRNSRCLWRAARPGHGPARGGATRSLPSTALEEDARARSWGSRAIWSSSEQRPASRPAVY
mmetsp:Transcript_65605/g.118195  ORF Transcript_65605/g.118195 Transcript_65605/m.118195 type:complete len:207 (-) Transcript_65605:455-1075(-)